MCVRKGLLKRGFQLETLEMWCEYFSGFGPWKVQLTNLALKT